MPSINSTPQNLLRKHRPTNTENLLVKGKAVVAHQRQLKAHSAKQPMDSVLAHCSNKPTKRKIDFVWDDERLMCATKAVVLRFADVLGMIPSQQRSPAHFFFYFKKCIMWWAYKCGMVTSVPPINCDKYALPIWLGNWIESWAPLRLATGQEITPHIPLLEPDQWSTQAVNSSLQGIAGNTPVQTATLSEGEKVYHPSVNVIADTVGAEMMEELSTIVISAFQTFKVEQLRKSTVRPEMYMDTIYVGFSSTNTAARHMTPINSTAPFRGMYAPPTSDTTIHGMRSYVMFNILASLHVTPHENPIASFKRHGVPVSNIHIKVDHIDFSVIGDLCTRLLGKLNLTPEQFLREWKYMYTLQVARYLSACPSWIRALQPISDRPYYATPAHQQIKTLPIFTDLQACGWYASNSITLILPTASSQPSLTSNGNFTAATNNSNAPYNQRSTFTTDPAAAFPVPPTGTLVNVVPIETLFRWQNAFHAREQALGMRVLPNRQWQCAASLTVTNTGSAYEPVTGVSMRETTASQLTSPYKMTPEQCYLWRTNVMVRQQGLSKYSERFEATQPTDGTLVSNAIPDESDLIRIGQARDQAQATIDCYRDKVLKLIPSADVTVDFLYDYVKDSIPRSIRPTKDQIKDLMNGKVNADQALSYLAGIAFNTTAEAFRQTLGNRSALTMRNFRLPGPAAYMLGNLQNAIRN